MGISMSFCPHSTQKKRSKTTLSSMTPKKKNRSSGTSSTKFCWLPILRNLHQRQIEPRSRTSPPLGVQGRLQLENFCFTSASGLGWVLCIFNFIYPLRSQLLSHLILPFSLLTQPQPSQLLTECRLPDNTCRYISRQIVKILTKQLMVFCTRVFTIHNSTSPISVPSPRCLCLYLFSLLQKCSIYKAF